MDDLDLRTDSAWGLSDADGAAVLAARFAELAPKYPPHESFGLSLLVQAIAHRDETVARETFATFAEMLVPPFITQQERKRLLEELEPLIDLGKRGRALRRLPEAERDAQFTLTALMPHGEARTREEHVLLIAELPLRPLKLVHLYQQCWFGLAYPNQLLIAELLYVAFSIEPVGVLPSLQEHNTELWMIQKRLLTELIQAPSDTHGGWILALMLGLRVVAVDIVLENMSIWSPSWQERLFEALDQLYANHHHPLSVKSTFDIISRRAALVSDPAAAEMLVNFIIPKNTVRARPHATIRPYLRRFLKLFRTVPDTETLVRELQKERILAHVKLREEQFRRILREIERGERTHVPTVWLIWLRRRWKHPKAEETRRRMVDLAVRKLNQ